MGDRKLARFFLRPFTAMVISIGLGSSAGTVSFDLSGVAFATAIVPPDTTTETTAALLVGSDTITAVYNGSPAFGPTRRQSSRNWWKTLIRMFRGTVCGGVDYKLSRCFAVRVVEVAWDRTTLPNATVSVKDNLRLGAGVMYKFGH